MRNIYIFILFLFVSNLSAQNIDKSNYESFCRDYSFQVGSGQENSSISVSHGSLFPNYVLPDITGVSHDLYSILNQGKTVVLEVMEFTGSLSTDEVKYLNHIKEVYQDQEGMIELLAIEKTPFTGIGLDVNTWYNENNLTYPLINMDGLDAFLTSEVTGLPTFFIIAPDKSYTKVFDFNYAHYILSTINKEVLATAGLDSIHDMDLFSVGHAYCGDSKNIYFTLQNTGAVTAEPYTINIYSDSNTLLDSKYEDHPIGPNGRVEYHLSYTSSILNSNNVRIEIISTESSENTLNNSKSFSFVENENFSGTEIEIRIQTDLYPNELAWILTNTSTDQIIDFDGLDSDNNIVGITGGYHSIPQSLNEGNCYILQMYDSVGDGICCNYGAGYIQVVDNSTGIVIADGGNFDISAKLEFKVNSSTIGVDEIEQPFNLKTIKKVQYFDLLGREFSESSKGISHEIILKKTTFTDNSVEIEKIHAY